jgi:hypothetical protein
MDGNTKTWYGGWLLAILVLFAVVMSLGSGCAGDINSRFASLQISDVTASAAELNIMDGVTATYDEINILEGVTATYDEINILEGVTATYDEINRECDKALADSTTQTVCGIRLNLVDGRSFISAWNGTGGALTPGKVYGVGYSGVAGSEVRIVAAATTTFDIKTAVAFTAAADSAITWVQVAGTCEAYVEGTTDVAAGDFLEVLNTEADWKKDGASRTTVSGAVAIDAQATNSAVRITVFLIEEQHTIAGS